MEEREREREEVEEKFEKYFGCLTRCEGKFCTTTLKIENFETKLVENAGKMPSKFQNRPPKRRKPYLEI